MKFNKLIFIGFGILFLSGCSLFSPVNTNPETNYRVNIVPPVAKKRTHSTILLVSQPDTSPIYNTRQMAYSNKRYQIAYFAKNQWAENPTNMLQRLIVQTLENTHYYHAVISPPTIGTYNYILSTQLLEFYQDFTFIPSLMRVSLQAQLTQASTGQIVASKQFTVIEPAPENTPYGGVIAANHAVARILKELTWFCLRRS